MWYKDIYVILIVIMLPSTMSRAVQSNVLNIEVTFHVMARKVTKHKSIFIIYCVCMCMEIIHLTFGSS